MWTVYKHTSPSNKVYIGITSQTCESRWSKGKAYKGSTLFNNCIKKYGWENIKHEILYEDLTYEEAIMREKELIKFYKNIGLSYNITDGGEGQLGNHPSEDTKKRISNTLKGNIPWNKGIPMSEEAKIKLSKSQTGKVRSKEFKENLSKICSGRSHSIESKKAIGNKNAGKVYIHNDNIFKKINKNEIQYYLDNGWVLGAPEYIKIKRSKSMSNKKWINNGREQLMVDPEYIEHYLQDGWKLGTICTEAKKNNYKLRKSENRKWMNKNGKTCQVCLIDVEHYLQDGWKLGRK